MNVDDIATKNVDEICCRICLDVEPKESIVSPCSCNGYSRYVHQNCLMEWASKDNKVKALEEQGCFQLECQICRRSIPLLMTEDKKWRNCKQIQQVMMLQKVRFIFQLCGILISICAVCYISKKLVEFLMIERQGIVDVTLQKYLAMITIGLILCCGIFMCFRFASNYLIQFIEKYKIDRDKLFVIQGAENSSANVLRVNPMNMIVPIRNDCP